MPSWIDEFGVERLNGVGPALSIEDGDSWARDVIEECLRESGGDILSALKAAEYILSLDETGREHKGKGPGGGQFVSKKESDGDSNDDDGKSSIPQKAKNAAKYLWRIFNAGPTAASWYIEHGGYSPKIAKTAYFVAMAGDYAVPGLPVGSAAVIIAGTIGKPLAPYRAVKKLIDKARELRKGKKSAAMSVDEPNRDAVIAVADALQDVDNQDWFLNVLAVAIEEEGGDVKSAVELAKLVVEDKPEPQTTDDSQPLSIDAVFDLDIHNRKAQRILNRALKASKGMSAAAKKDLAAALKKTGNELGSAILDFINKYRVHLANILATTQLSALLEGAEEIAAKVPPLGEVPIEGLPVTEQDAILTPPNKPPLIAISAPSPDEPGGVHLKTIEKAVKNLAERNVINRESFDALDAAARAKAFTVANVAAEETLTKIRDSLAENVKEGADYETWSKKVLDVDQGTFMGEGHMCFLPGTIIEGEVVAASKIWYEGPIALLETEGGRVLSVTVNHRIMTPDGWKYAGDFKQGDNLICHGRRVESFYSFDSYTTPVDCFADSVGATQNNNNIPFFVEEVFEAVLKQSATAPNSYRPIGTLNFDGNLPMRYSQIGDIRTDSVRAGNINAATEKGPHQIRLMERHGLAARSPLRIRDSLIHTRLQSSALPSDGINSISSEDPPLIIGQLAEPNFIRVGPTSHLNPSIFKTRSKSLGGDVQLCRQLCVRLPSFISTDRVRKVEFRWWHGHVYDLQTRTGFVVSQGIVSSNSTIFRTNVQEALSSGQASVLSHPLVRSGFPYSVYDAIHDDRVRENHLALEKLGIDGTNIYRNDDPVFQMFRPPWDYNDRCGWTPITVRHAADRGIKEAIEWLETGIEPAQKAFVEMPPFRPPPGFQRSLSAMPLSIQLSMQPAAMFSTEFERKHPRGEDGEFVEKGNESAKPKQTKEEKAAEAEKRFEELMATKSESDVAAFRKARADGVAIPPAWTEVTYYGKDKPVRAEGRDAKGRRQRAEDPNYRQRISDENNARIARELTPRINEVREKLREDAAAGNEESKVLYLIAQSGFRIGGKGDGKAKVEAFGATTIQGQHVTVNGDTVTFDFPGKKGVRQQHTINDPVIAAMMKDKQDGKPIFSTRAEKVRDAWQNRYGGTKVHDIRHVVATEIAERELKNRIPPPPKNERERTKIIKEVAKASGAKLGNNPSQALGTYIDPGLWSQIQVAA